MFYSLINNIENGKIGLLFYRFLALDKEQRFKKWVIEDRKINGVLC